MALTQNDYAARAAGTGIETCIQDLGGGFAAGRQLLDPQAVAAFLC